MLNKEKYKLFWKQGFIIEKNFFNQNEIKKFNNELKEIILSYSNLSKNQLRYKKKEIYNQLLIKISRNDKKIISYIYDTICYTQSFISCIAISKFKNMSIIYLKIN